MQTKSRASRPRLETSPTDGESLLLFSAGCDGLRHCETQLAPSWWFASAVGPALEHEYLSATLMDVWTSSPVVRCRAHSGVVWGVVPFFTCSHPRRTCRRSPCLLAGPHSWGGGALPRQRPVRWPGVQVRQCPFSLRSVTQTPPQLCEWICTRQVIRPEQFIKKKKVILSEPSIYVKAGEKKERIKLNI